MNRFNLWLDTAIAIMANAKIGQYGTGNWLLNWNLPYLVVAFLVWFHCGICQEETHCAGYEIKMSHVQKAQIAECLDEAGIKSLWKIPVTKLSCFGVCILEKKGLLTPDGKINHEKSLKYIETLMPDKVKKPLIDGVDKCIKVHGQNVKVENDPNCSVFLDVGQCVHDVFFDVCL